MTRKLIIDGTAVYEIDEECMLTKRLDKEEKQQEPLKKTSEETEKGME